MKNTKYSNAEGSQNYAEYGNTFNDTLKIFQDLFNKNKKQDTPDYNPPAPTPPPPPVKDNTALYWGLGIGGAVLLTTMIIVIVKSRK